MCSWTGSSPAAGAGHLWLGPNASGYDYAPGHHVFAIVGNAWPGQASTAQSSTNRPHMHKTQHKQAKI